MSHRNLFSLFIGLFVLPIVTWALCFPSMVSSAETAIVSVSAPSQIIDPGETFTVDIVVDPNNAIAGIQFDLSFNPSLVAVNSIEEGDLLSQNGANTYFNPGNINNSAGTITGVFGVIISPEETVSSKGTFATISFIGKTIGGTCPLTLSSVIIGDIEGQSVSLNVNNGVVIINSLPILNAIGNKIVNEGELLSFTISATDSDDDNLTYSASNLPAGASFSQDTKKFSWTPGYAQAGTYLNIHFEVTDGSLTNTENINISVYNICQPDISNDGFVNVLDLIIAVQHWGEVGQNSWISEDVNEDGTVNVLDIILIGQYWTE